MTQSASRRVIALCIHALHGGGAERLMSNLATRWSPKHEVHLVTWAEEHADDYPLPESVTRHRLGLQSNSRNALQGLWANWRRVRGLRQTLQKITPEFVLSFSDQMNIVTLEATRRMSVPVWIAEHSDPAQQQLGRFWESWRRRSYPSCDGCVVLTHAIADYMERWIPRERLKVIPPAIEGQTLSSPETKTRVQSDGGKFLFVGRISGEKRLALLLDAWREAQPQLPNWSLDIVGDGPQRLQLVEQYAHLPELNWLGWITNPVDHMARADVFVLSSDYEGFPVALLEALDQGLPAISTPCSSALSELNALGKCLEIIAPSNAGSMARAMVELANDHDRRRRMSAKSHLVAEQYYWSNVGPKWDAILNVTE